MLIDSSKNCQTVAGIAQQLTYFLKNKLIIKILQKSLGISYPSTIRQPRAALINVKTFPAKICIFSFFSKFLINLEPKRRKKIIQGREKRLSDNG